MQRGGTRALPTLPIARHTSIWQELADGRRRERLAAARSLARYSALTAAVSAANPSFASANSIPVLSFV
jgi:hypothetical protein